ncbi:MAG: amidohydrolase [Albidovulum sp.]|nr:amidohydrolase [Albidovulum sp.]
MEGCDMITLFPARKIITMDRNLPEATHVAARDGIVLAVGGPDCAEAWGASKVDGRFADKVLIPGLVEAHAHIMAGGVWRFEYVGHYPRSDPDGVSRPGAETSDEILSILRKSASGIGRGKFVVGWGYDGAFVEGPRMDRQMLDLVSPDQPVVVMHSNFHVLTANSKALEICGIESLRGMEGVCEAPDGALTGELQELSAMDPVMEKCGLRLQEICDESALRDYGKLARSCGVTTVADLFSILDDDEVRMLLSVTSEKEFPVRYAPVMSAMGIDPGEAARRARAIRAKSTPKLHLGSAKLFTDGAIQGGTAMLKPPGYLNRPGNGMWNMDMGEFREAVSTLHSEGIKIHVHANGDEASEQTIRAFEEAIGKAPNPDLRHTLEHAQLAGEDQFKRMRALGLTVNLFANHVHYFGDVHIEKSLGMDRARSMDACADAWDVFGGDFAIHSDAPVTPLAPLKTAWCAVNRVSMGGRKLGDSQCISVKQALHCITLGAAYVLKLDDRVGSIKCGKYADFCALEADPLELPPLELADIPVVGTVLGGEVTS